MNKRRSKLVATADRVRQLRLGPLGASAAAALDRFDSQLRGRDFRARQSRRVYELLSSDEFRHAATHIGATASFDALRRKPIGLFDIGARGGPLLAAYPFGDFVALVLCEPDPREFRSLKRTAGFRQCCVEQRLIGAQPGRGALNLTRKPGGSSLLVAEPSTDDRHQIIDSIERPIVTIDEVSRELAIDCEALKIDVQGTEFDVLRGCTSLPFCVRVEVSSFPMYRGQRLSNEVHDLLESRGYILLSDRRRLGDDSFHGDLVYSRRLIETDSPDAILRWLVSHGVLGALHFEALPFPGELADYVALLRRHLQPLLKHGLI